MTHVIGIQGLRTSSKCEQMCINILSSCKNKQKPDIQNQNNFFSKLQDVPSLYRV